jgi:hypothetical protein
VFSLGVESLPLPLIFILLPLPLLKDGRLAVDVVPAVVKSTILESRELTPGQMTYIARIMV